MTAKLSKYSMTALLTGFAGILLGIIGNQWAADPSWIKFFDNLHWTSATAAAAVLSWISLHAADPEQRTLRKWLALGLTGYALGQILWDVQVAVRYAGFPGPADFFYLWLGPCLAVGLISGIYRLANPSQRQAFFLDIAALSVAVLTLVMAVYLPKRGDTDLLSLTVLIAYPASLLGAACIVLVLIPSLRLRISLGWLLFLLSLLATGWSWMTWNNMALDGATTDGAWFNSTFSFGILMLGASTLLLKFEQSPSPSWDKACEGLLRLFPLLAVVVAALAVVFANILENVPEPVHDVANYASLTVIILATTRQVLLLKERDLLIAAQRARQQAENLLRLSEERWKFALEGAGDGVWDWNISRGEVFYSKRWKEMIGYAEAEFEDSFAAWETHLHPDDKQATLAALDAYLQGKSSTYQVEFRLRCKDGRWKWILGRGKVVAQDASGKPLRMIGTHTDITARRDMEQSVLQNEAGLRFMLENSPIAVRIAGGSEHRVVYANPRYAELINAEPEQVLGTDPKNFYKNPQAYPAILQQLAEGQKIANRLVELQIPGHGSKWALASYLDLEYANQPAVLAWFYDITERKNLEEELTRYRESLEVQVRKRTAELEDTKTQAEKANRAKSEFLARMSHELRTPMNAILGFSQLLEAEPLNQDQHDFVSEIHLAGNHLLELINDLLDLSRIESGRLALELKAVALSNPIEQSIQLVKPLLERGRIKLTSSCIAPLSVLADATRLKQILVNLLSNAAKYNRKGGEITVDCQLIESKSVRLSVTDTGRGISPEKLEQLFIPFERLGAEFTDIEGTGVGLALSKRLAEMMGGKLGVKSVVGQGSTFWIDLPLAQSVAASIANNPPQPTPFNDSGNETRVLYIEDNAANIKLVEGIFRSHPSLSLLSAANGEYGLELVTQYQPMVILLDIHLPGMDGYAVLRALQENPETRDIPVIAISADAMPIDIERGLAAGFHDYLTKPLRVDELISKLNALISARAAHKV